MKLGMILECSAGGPDKDVYPFLVEYFCNKIKADAIETDTLINKKLLIEKCADSAKFLLYEKNCDKVFIIWDLHPGWGTKVCRHKDTESIFDKLKENNIPIDKVKLICIEAMLESFFLTDGKGVTIYFQSKTDHRINPFKNGSYKTKNPKDVIIKYTKNNKLRDFNDFKDSFGIIKSYDNYDKIIKKNPSFNRLYKSIIEICD